MSYYKSSEVRYFIFSVAEFRFFRKYASYFRIYFNGAKSLKNKGIKEKPIEMSHRKGSGFNRLFTSKNDFHYNYYNRIESSLIIIIHFLFLINLLKLFITSISSSENPKFLHSSSKQQESNSLIFLSFFIKQIKIITASIAV